MIEVGLRGLIEINSWAAWNGILDLLPLTSSSSMYIASHQSVTSPDQCQSVSRRQWRITYLPPVNKADLLFGSHFSTIIWLLYQIRSYQCPTTATKGSERGASFAGNYQSYISESVFIHQPTTTVVHLCPHLTYLLAWTYHLTWLRTMMMIKRCSSSHHTGIDWAGWWWVRSSRGRYIKSTEFFSAPKFLGDPSNQPMTWQNKISPPVDQY